ncbi:MAG: hypothetical protein QW292_03600 [Candidatus Parvarchaeota archaeon]
MSFGDIKEKDIETLSNPEKITEKQDVVQSPKNRRKIMREDVWLILSGHFLAARVTLAIVMTIIKNKKIYFQYF